jgi:hypothetical protein
MTSDSLGVEPDLAILESSRELMLLTSPVGPHIPIDLVIRM